MTPPVLDVHAHLWIDAVEAAARKHPHYAVSAALEQRRLGADSVAVNAAQAQMLRGALTDVAIRLQAMDAARVDVQLVSIAPTQYHNWSDPALAQHIASLTNAGVAAHCALTPDRLIGIGVVPWQYPELAVTALEEAVLGHGLRGIEISSHATGPVGGTVELSDRRLDALWRRVEELGAVVFMHPWGCSLDERLDQWYLANSVGQPVEHAVALSHFIFGGVLDRFPGVRLIAAHGGGYLPAFISRADHAWRNRADARGCVEPPSSYLPRIWFDSLVHDSDALRRLISVVGSDRVVLGSDFPFDMGESDPVGQIMSANLSEDVASAVVGGNAQRLGLSPPPTHVKSKGIERSS